ncbi:hypothetical protein GOBAR_AA11495 [Gossypium barbadense]|uniref:Uncharacterized protein n=1 Tax=Gossypium barbadense TaxID=3634 RepID=A0A2P5Y0M9_GOSBA|nr:hypothetical protein GOBAR_AA11495 [Gossypium barbadense]
MIRVANEKSLIPQVGRTVTKPVTFSKRVGQKGRQIGREVPRVPERSGGYRVGNLWKVDSKSRLWSARWAAGRGSLPESQSGGLYLLQPVLEVLTTQVVTIGVSHTTEIRWWFPRFCASARALEKDIKVGLWLLLQGFGRSLNYLYHGNGSPLDTRSLYLCTATGDRLYEGGASSIKNASRAALEMWNHVLRHISVGQGKGRGEVGPFAAALLEVQLTSNEG